MLVPRMKETVHLNGPDWHMMILLPFMVHTLHMPAFAHYGTSLDVCCVSGVHDRLLNSGYDIGMCEVIVSMLQRDPADRLTPDMAVDVLSLLLREMEGECDE